MALVMENLTRFGRIECSQVNASGACYPKHTHEEYVISANLSGVERIWYNGRQQEVLSGEVTLYNPMTVQSSEFCGEGAQFISLHLDEQQVRSILDQTTHDNGLPAFQEGNIRDSALFGSILDLHEQLHSSSRDEALLVLFSELARFRSTPDTSGEPLRVAHLIRFMKANLYEAIELEDLCAEANLSRFHLVRSFKAEKNLPPMQYFKQLRLIEARRRLRLGDAPARIAVELGFFDQAHLSNAFRKVMGASPSSYSSMLGVAR
ncbi:AraC family transcriptional regulator [Pseudomonas sp. BJa5]|uniref:helix-turn-helix transcriptional regulator n=1 Tax=Pseudomonas sp. BJa5 TaxID=2936270 RepID=UPI0025598E60|nr:AraC family transcriptional regulator [Pseudomonas sp. BGr12]MDL2420967.1 AraC family transcriptional regulator [Pseudomonas sp. BGr12]